MKRSVNVNSSFIELCSVSGWPGHTSYDIAVRVIALLAAEGIECTSHGSRAALILVKEQDTPRAMEIILQDAHTKKYQVYSYSGWHLLHSPSAFCALAQQRPLNFPVIFPERIRAKILVFNRPGYRFVQLTFPQELG